MESCSGDYEIVACRKEHSRRSDCLCTPNLIQQLQVKVMEDPGKEMWALAWEVGFVISTMKLALNEDLHYQSYKRCNGQFTENRLTKAKNLLNKMKHPVESVTIWFFTDEKNFCQDQLHNTQNRWLALIHMMFHVSWRPSFPKLWWFLGVSPVRVISCHPPQIFEQGLRLNSDGYEEVLNNMVKPWLERVASGRLYVWQ